MQLKKIKIFNVSSFVNFQNEAEFQKLNLVFGTNGSGKSTLVELFQLLNKFHTQDDLKSEDELKSFFRERFSKESNDELATVELKINSNELKITYNKNHDTLESTNSGWTPIKVFNDEYTSRTIGNSFEMNLKSGIIIGEKNIELDNEYQKKKYCKKIKII